MKNLLDIIYKGYELDRTNPAHVVIANQIFDLINPNK